ncbi:hypothetical protein J2751_002282 [Halorubrum alkaliphilum]|uniref:Uncharacterized protein n=1 Tax=Halorubrum alkaliphilum TaxID=261290 RepID=A0A8T4GGG9_9EURY|nr:hypothetical protein [Halorubrum alkaliphilum]
MGIEIIKQLLWNLHAYFRHTNVFSQEYH